MLGVNVTSYFNGLSILFGFTNDELYHYQYQYQFELFPCTNTNTNPSSINVKPCKNFVQRGAPALSFIGNVTANWLRSLAPWTVVVHQ